MREPPVGMPPDLRGGRVPALPPPDRPGADEDDGVDSIYDYD